MVILSGHKNCYPTKRIAVLFLFLTLFLQSCRSLVNLKNQDTPYWASDPPASYLENYHYSLISTHVFTSSSGEDVIFFQENGFFKAKVKYRAKLKDYSILPVICEEGAHLATKLENLAQQAVALQKQRIHIISRGKDTYVFIGYLGLKGGMLGGEEANILIFHEVIKARDLELLKTLLARGYDPNIADEIGVTPLYLASIKGYLEIVELLLKNEANPNMADINGETPLHWAAYYGHLEIVNLLLEKGAKVNITDQGGYTPLSLAVEKGHVAIAGLLLEKGADPNIATANDKSTPLHWAAFYGNLELVNLLLEKGADHIITDQDGLIPLYRAIDQGHLAIVRLLLAKVVDPNMAIADKSTPLHWAAYDGNLEIVNLLLEKGVDHTITDQDGFTPIYLAIDQGHAAIVKVLLAKGTDPNMAIADKSTPLHWAAYDGNLEIVNLLLENGADPTIGDAENSTPLHIAAYRGHMPILLRLLLCNLDINAQDEDGDTFLHNLLSDTSLSTQDLLYRFLEAIKTIEKNQDVLLNNITEVMQDYCPELTNEDGKSILAMVIDYMQGVDLTLEDQNDTSIIAIVKSLLGTAMHNQEHGEEVVKTLDRHQNLGGWVRSSIQHKRKAGTSAQGAPASKKYKLEYEE